MTINLMTLSGGADAVLADACKHPTVLKSRTAEALAKACVAEAENRVVSALTETVVALIEEAYEMHCICEGPRADSEARTDWDSALATTLEVLFDPYIDYLSSDWLARVTSTDGEDFSATKLAQSFGLAVYKHFAGKRGSEAEFLLAVGIGPQRLRDALGVLPPAPEKALKSNGRKGAKSENTARAEPTLAVASDDPQAVFDGAIRVLSQIATQRNVGADDLRNFLSWLLCGPLEETPVTPHTAVSVMESFLGDTVPRATAEHMVRVIRSAYETQGPITQDTVAGLFAHLTSRAQAEDHRGASPPPPPPPAVTNLGDALELFSKFCGLDGATIASALGTTEQTWRNWTRKRTGAKLNAAKLLWLADMSRYYGDRLVELEGEFRRMAGRL